jgi:hypothetical protein
MKNCLTYKFNEKDLNEILKFIRDYHLNPTKGQRGRTNQGKRGFGGELDEWIPGKLIEIAVCRILERYDTSKKLYPDFKIYSNKEVGDKSDPDITEVQVLNNKKRKPNVFVEIKRFGESERWLGIKKEQLKDMTEGYMVHATIEFADSKNKKQRDITASVLKILLNKDKFDLSEFSEFSDLQSKIEYIYSFKDLKEKSHFFASGNIIPETDFPSTRPAYRKDGTLSKVYPVLQEYKGSHNFEMKWENKNELPTFCDWEVEGEFHILQDKSGKSCIYAATKTKMFSEVFGKFLLEGGKTYRFYFKNTLGKSGGKDVFKSKDDYWFSRKRLDELLKNHSLPDSLKCINKIIGKI